MSRALIYALNAPVSQGGKLVVPQYVTRQLELLRPVYDEVFTVPHKNVPNNGASNNSGPIGAGDWANWSTGIHDAGWDALAGHSLTLMTAAAFGPTYSLTQLLDRLDNDDADYFVFSNAGVPFFYYFTAKVVNSGAFRAFWDVKPPADANSAKLRQHLFPALNTAGFKAGVAIEIDSKAPVVGMADAHAPRPDLWAEADSPYLLIEDLLDRPDYLPYALDYLGAGGYPAATASAQLSQLSSPDEKGLMWAKQRDYRHAAPAEFDGETQPEAPKVAIHLHAHYPDMLSEFFALFEKYLFPFKLFITTSENKVAEIEQHLGAYQFDVEVVAVPNLGRDVYPLFLLHDKLSKFEVIGHFHTKKSNHERKFVADSWLQELMDTVVAPGNNIVSDFAHYPELGVVIADVPSFFRVNRIVYPEGEAPLVPIANKLWDRMNLIAESPFVPHHVAVMSYGNFFWARYDAIRPLLELNVADELPPEPVPENHTILHAIERLWVYVAWAQGYDYAISEGRYLTVFGDAAAPTLEAVPFSTLARQKVAHRIPVPVKRRILGLTGWKAKD